jgi:anti-sigma-K factor RskA
MIDERTEELASLYAFDLLDGAELAAFEARLAGDAELRALVRELRETASALALTAPAAALPAGLKSRLLAQIPDRPHATPFTPFVWIPWALAACLAVASVWLIQLYFQQRSETVALQEEISLARIETQAVQNQLAAERIVTGRQLADWQEKIKDHGDVSHLEIAHLDSLAGRSSPTRATAIWNQALQEGVFSAEKLPAPAPDKDYQLWIIDPKYPDPVSAGIFAVDARTGEARLHFRPSRPIATAAKFAVSCERKGGRPKPEGPIVLLSE